MQQLSRQVLVSSSVALSLPSSMVFSLARSRNSFLHFSSSKELSRSNSLRLPFYRYSSSVISTLLRVRFSLSVPSSSISSNKRFFQWERWLISVSYSRVILRILACSFPFQAVSLWAYSVFCWTMSFSLAASVSKVLVSSETSLLLASIAFWCCASALSFSALWVRSNASSCCECWCAFSFIWFFHSTSACMCCLLSSSCCSFAASLYACRFSCSAFRLSTSLSLSLLAYSSAQLRLLSLACVSPNSSFVATCSSSNCVIRCYSSSLSAWKYLDSWSFSAMCFCISCLNCCWMCLICASFLPSISEMMPLYMAMMSFRDPDIPSRYRRRKSTCSLRISFWVQNYRLRPACSSTRLRLEASRQRTFSLSLLGVKVSPSKAARPYFQGEMEPTCCLEATVSFWAVKSFSLRCIMASLQIKQINEYKALTQTHKHLDIITLSHKAMHEWSLGRE